MNSIGHRTSTVRFGTDLILSHSRKPAQRHMWEGQPVARVAVLLDRDGVITEDQSDYIKSWGQVRFVPGALKALSRLSQSEYAVVLVTNQSVVGRGIITLDLALEIHGRVIAEIEDRGGRVDASYLCPHHPKDMCGCRKPAPGMLLRAAQDLDLDLARSFVVGDAVSDIEAASAVNARGILVLTGRGKEQVALLERVGKEDCLVVADLEAAVDSILARGEAKGVSSA